jgi:hypothetical protein
VTHGEPDHAFSEPERLLACFGTADKQRQAQQKAKEMAGQDTTFARELYDKSCVTCRLFGNAMMRGRFYVSDAMLVVEPQLKLFDHVAIDRFHGGAEDKRKFDTRPLMPTITGNTDHSSPPTFQAMFSLRLHLERFELWMLGLLGHLLKDLHTSNLRLGHAVHRGYGRVKGIVTGSDLLVLPGSELESLCLEHGVLSQDQAQRQRLGPYWRVSLGFPRLFGSEPWTSGGLQGEVLDTPAAQLLLDCDRRFRDELLPHEEGKEHGSF